MTMNVGKEVAALQRMTVDDLRQKYAEVFQETTSRLKKTLRGGGLVELAAAISTGRFQGRSFVILNHDKREPNSN